MLKNILFVLILFFCLDGFSQQSDSLLTKNSQSKSDTNKVKKLGQEIKYLFKDSTKLQNPRKAVLRSAIIPGWGQARNKKWWKVPLVYGGFVGLGLVYNFNNDFYKEFLKESQFRKANQTIPLNDRFLYPEYQGISDEQIYNAKDFYRRNRDLTLYGMIGFYGLQMIDAYIDARLATFDVGESLSIKIKPSIFLPSHSFASTAATIPMLTFKIHIN